MIQKDDIKVETIWDSNKKKYLSEGSLEVKSQLLSEGDYYIDYMEDYIKKNIIYHVYGDIIRLASFTLSDLRANLKFNTYDDYEMVIEAFQPFLNIEKIPQKLIEKQHKLECHPNFEYKEFAATYTNWKNEGWEINKFAPVKDGIIKCMKKS